MDFGHALLEQFPLEPGGIYLNHGTVGVTPLAVMRARAAILEEIERHPSRYMIRELMQLGMSAAAGGAAAARRGRAGRGIPRRRAPRTWCSSTTRAAASMRCCARSSSSPATRSCSPTTPTAAWPAPPPSSPGSAARRSRPWRCRSRRATRPSASARRRRDHAAHPAGGARPRQLRDRARHAARGDGGGLPRSGVPVLVDGAHAPGRSRSTSPRSASTGMPPTCTSGLRAAQLRHPVGGAGAAAALHPGVISWGITNDDWLQEFEWTGTRDPSPWLAAPAGLDFMRDVLGVEAMRA